MAGRWHLLRPAGEAALNLPRLGLFWPHNVRSCQPDGRLASVTAAPGFVPSSRQLLGPAGPPPVALDSRMGQYLATPNTEKETLHGSHERLHYGISAQQGWRKHMVSL